MPPTLVDDAKLENLLEGYDPEPVLDAECIIKDSDPDDGPLASRILEALSQYANIADDTVFEVLLGECVQNIRQHCSNNSYARFYQKVDKSAILGLFELNGHTQFGSASLENYREILKTTQEMVNNGEHSRRLENCELRDGVHIGTSMFFRADHVERLGIADVDGKAYFFYEYRISKN